MDEYECEKTNIQIRQLEEKLKKAEQAYKDGYLQAQGRYDNPYKPDSQDAWEDYKNG